MPNSNPQSMQPLHPRPLNRIWLALIALFSFIGFTDAAYLTADHYLALPLPCTVTHGCETVLTSKYAMIGFVPLAGFGVIFYLFLLFAAVYALTSANPSKRVLQAICALTLIGALASCAFIYIQAELIHAFCMYCLGSAADTLILLILAIPLEKYILSMHKGSKLP